jgi:AraC-like DNA-binding protein
MRYEEFRPAASVAHLVAQCWRFEAGDLAVSPSEHMIVPDGLPSLFATFVPGAAVMLAGIVGPAETAVRTQIVRQQISIGVRLKPGVAPRLFEVSMPALAGRSLSFSQFAPRLEAAFEDAARCAVGGDWSGITRFLFARAETAPAPDGAAAAMAARLIATDGRARIGDLSAVEGVSPRQARRRFIEAVGLSPKSFARVRRIRRACIAALGDAGWSHVSLEAGFADQPHLARNFQAVFERRPSEVLAYIKRIAHSNVESGRSQ